MLGSTLIRDQVVQVRKPRQKRSLTAPWMMEPLHRKQLPLDGIMGLIEQRAGHGHLRVCEDRIPASLLGLKPASHALAIGRSSGGSDVVHTVAEPLPQRKHPQALALACPVPQGVELCAQRLARRGRDGYQFLRELGKRVAQAGAHAYARKERPHTFGRAVKAIGEDSFDSVRRLVLDCCTVIHTVGLGKGCRAGLLGVAEMSNHAPTDNGRQVHFGWQTRAVFLIGEETAGQKQPTPSQDCILQMVIPPRRTRMECEWRVRHPPPRQVALCLS